MIINGCYQDTKYSVKLFNWNSSTIARVLTRQFDLLKPDVMKTLNFSFNHPVAVKVFFTCLSDPRLKHDIKFVRSDGSGSLSIPLDSIPPGSWKVMLEWNFENRDFCMEKFVDLTEPLATGASSDNF